MIKESIVQATREAYESSMIFAAKISSVCDFIDLASHPAVVGLYGILEKDTEEKLTFDEFILELIRNAKDVFQTDIKLTGIIRDYGSFSDQLTTSIEILETLYESHGKRSNGGCPFYENFLSYADENENDEEWVLSFIMGRL